VWNLESGTEEFKLTHPGHCWRVQFSPDGQRLLTLGVSHVPILWDISKRLAIRELPAQVQPVCGDTTFNADGSQIVTHVPGGDVKLWNTRTWEGRILPGPERVAEYADWLHVPLVASPDGQWLAAGSPSGFKVWATADWRDRPTVKTPATWLAFSPDGRTLYTAPHDCPDDQSPTVARWDTATGAPRGKSAVLASHGPWMVYHLSVDGRTLYAMACDPAESTIHVYDAETLVERFLPATESSKSNGR
jgi:WD40 repeat protein